MLIVTGSDDNYVPGVLVLIASAAYHNPQADFAVLALGISDTNLDRIRNLGKQLSIDVAIIEVCTDHFDRFTVRRSHLTHGAFLRLLIPDLFGDHEQVIYLDSDMIVLGSLMELQARNLDGFPVAAVACPDPDKSELTALNIQKGHYFNSGLLVIDISTWKRLQISEKAAEVLQDGSANLLHEDQSALNIVCQNNVKLLPSSYNVYATLSAYGSLDSFPQNPIIIHFVVNSKPWRVTSEFQSVWNAYADRISDLIPKRKPISVGDVLTNINFSRKRMTEALSLSDKHKSRTKMRRVIQKDIVEPALLQISG